MSTNSTIAVQHKDGSVSQVYCHWDGYVSWNGKMLLEHYNSLLAAEKLVALGDISSLNRSIAGGVGHTFNDPIKGETVFYGRDRNDPNTAPSVFATLSDYYSKFDGQEYNYLFRNGEWEVHSYNSDGWTSVAEALEIESAARAE